MRTRQWGELEAVLPSNVDGVRRVQEETEALRRAGEPEESIGWDRLGEVDGRNTSGSAQEDAEQTVPMPASACKARAQGQQVPTVLASPPLQV